PERVQARVRARGRRRSPATPWPSASTAADARPSPDRSSRGARSGSPEQDGARWVAPHRVERDADPLRSRDASGTGLAVRWPARMRGARMGETYDAFGRRHRADRGGPGIASRPPRDLSLVLSDLASPGARERLREQLAQEGYDLATLPDAEARRVLSDLVEAGRIAVDDVPVPMLRAPV